MFLIINIAAMRRKIQLLKNNSLFYRNNFTMIIRLMIQKIFRKEKIVRGYTTRICADFSRGFCEVTTNWHWMGYRPLFEHLLGFNKGVCAFRYNTDINGCIFKKPLCHILIPGNTDKPVQTLILHSLL